MSDTEVKIYRRSDLTPEVSLTGQIPQPGAADINAAIAEFYAEAEALLDAVNAYLDSLQTWNNNPYYRAVIQGIENMAVQDHDPNSQWNLSRESLGEKAYEDTIADASITDTIAGYFGMQAVDDEIVDLTDSTYDHVIRPTNQEIRDYALNNSVSWSEAEAVLLEQNRSIKDIGTMNNLMDTLPISGKQSLTAVANSDMIREAAKGTGSDAVANKVLATATKTKILGKRMTQDFAALIKATDFSSGLDGLDNWAPTDDGTTSSIIDELLTVPSASPYTVSLSQGANLVKNSLALRRKDNGLRLALNDDYVINSDNTVKFLQGERTVSGELNSVPATPPYTISLNCEGLLKGSRTVYWVQPDSEEILLVEGRDYTVNPADKNNTITFESTFSGMIVKINYLCYRTDLIGKQIYASYNYMIKKTAGDGVKMTPAQMMKSMLDTKWINQGAAMIRSGVGLVRAVTALPAMLSQKLQASIDLSAVTGPLCQMLDVFKSISNSINNAVNAVSNAIGAVKDLANALKGFGSSLGGLIDGISFPGVNMGFNLSAGCLGNVSSSLGGGLTNNLKLPSL